MRCEYGNCSWAIIDNRVIVKSANGSKSARLDGTPESIVCVLMWQLFHEQQPTWPDSNSSEDKARMLLEAWATPRADRAANSSRDRAASSAERSAGFGVFASGEWWSTQAD